MLKKIGKKLISLIALYALLVQALSPLALINTQKAFAQETAQVSASPSPTDAPTPAPSSSSAVSQTPAPTVLPSASPSDISTPVPTDTPVPTATPESTPIASPVDTITPSPTPAGNLSPPSKDVQPSATLNSPQWQENPDGSQTTTGTVSLNQVYKAPQNSKVTVTFTKLPDNPGKLTITEVKLTADQQKATGSLSDTAYNISSDMTDGTFQYNLTLPVPDTAQGKTLGIKSSETVDGLKTSGVNQANQTTGNVVTITGLNHFTIFIVVDDGGAGYSDNGWNVYTSAGYDGDHHWVSPSQTGKVATWTFNGDSGVYAILPSWVIWDDHATNAHYTSSNIIGFDLTGVNQKEPANASVTDMTNGTWSGWFPNSGRYNLVSGNTITLSVEASTSGNLAADAIAFVGMSEIYVDASWAGDITGADLGGGKIFGINAFATIQDGINAVSSGGTVNVAAGNYAENPNISKNITLQGVSGANLTGQITISSDNVTVDGMNIKNQDSGSGIISTDHSNLHITNNTIHDIGTSLKSGSAQAIGIISNSADVTNITINGNTISDIGNTGMLHAGSAGSSAKGVYLGNSTGSNTISNVAISDNTMNNIYASTAGWIGGSSYGGGAGAYGVLVNHKTTGLNIANNTIGTLKGLWAHAIGLESNTPGAVITGNTVTGLTDHKLGTDSMALRLESNPSASTVTLTGNTFNGKPLSLATSTVSVDGSWSTLSSGSNTYPEVLASDGTYRYYGINAFSKIQDGVNGVSADGTVDVAPGTYTESITINKSLTLNGAQEGIDARGRNSSSESIIPAQSGGVGNSAISIKANNVTIDGFYIQGAGTPGNQTWGINAAAGVATSGVHITNTIFKNLYEGLHVQGPSTNVSSGMTVDKNEFFDESGDVYKQDAGIWMASAVSNDLTIKDNSFFGHDHGDGGDYAAINIDNSTNLTITNNTSHNDGSFVVLVNNTTVNVSENTSTNTGSGFNQSSTIFVGLGNNGVTIQNNNLDNGYRGVRLSNDFGTGLNQNIQVLNNIITNMANAGILVPVNTISDQVVVNRNQITGNPIGVQNDNSNPLVKATCNWWGSATGPGPVGPGSGDKVSTNVDFSTWLTTPDLNGLCNGPDTTKPTVSFTLPTPANNAYVNSNFDVGYTASDNVALKSVNVSFYDTDSSHSNHWVATCYNNSNESGTSDSGICKVHLPSNLSDGKYYVQVGAQDMALNWSVNAIRTIYVDRTAPTATIDGVAPKALYNGSTNINVHAIDTNYLQTELYREGESSPFKIYTGEWFGLFWLADDSYRMVVVDKAGNSTEYKFTIDKTAPNVPTLVSPANGAFVKPGGLILDWSDVTDPSLPVTYYYQSSYSSAVGAGNGFVSPIYNKNTGTASQIDASGSSDHLYYWQVRACDSVGNCSNWSGPWAVNIDSTAPAVPTGIYFKDTVNNKDVACGGITSARNFDVYWNANTEADFDHYEYVSFNADGSVGPIRTFTTPYFNASWWTVPVQGTYGVQVRAVDKAGNKSAWFGGSEGINNSCTYTVDWTAPSAPTITSPSNGDYFNSIPITANWTAVTDTSGIAKYQVGYVYDDHHTFSGSTCSDLPNGGCRDVAGNVTSRGHVPGLNEQGGVTIYVRAVDNAGNVGAWSAPVHYVYDATAPALTANPLPGDQPDNPTNVALIATDNLSGVKDVYYTTDGTNPATSATKVLYSSPIVVDRDLTINAIAYDNAGNSTTFSGVYNVPPIISDQKIVRTGDNSVLITWATNFPATSRVVYDTVSHPTLGSAPNYGYAYSTVEDTNKVTSHSVTVNGLTVNQDYYYRTISAGSPEAVGNETAFSTYYIFGLPGDGRSDGGSSGGGGAPSAGPSVLAANTIQGVLGANTSENAEPTLQETAPGQEVLGAATESAKPSSTPTPSQKPALLTKGISMASIGWAFVVLLFVLLSGILLRKYLRRQ